MYEPDEFHLHQIKRMFKRKGDWKNCRRPKIRKEKKTSLELVAPFVLLLLFLLLSRNVFMFNDARKETKLTVALCRC